MRRVLNVVRLQMINRQTFIWIPLIILVGAVLLSVVIYAMIPVDAPKYGGAGQAPLWYFFAVGIAAMTYTFPFSQAMSITRRDFFLGTMLTAIIGSLFLAVLFLIGGGIETLTGGYGVNGFVFYLPWLWDAGPVAAFLFFFVTALGLFVLGFTGATIYKRWGPFALTMVGIVLAVIVVGLVFVVTQLDLWATIWQTVGTMGAVGLTLWGAVGVVVLGGVSFLAFRRATP